MIADHTAATEALTAAAEAEGMTVPAGLDPRHQAMLEELQQAGDDAFDSAYLTMQRQAHTEAVALHQAVADAGEAGGALSAYAADVLPVLEEHLQMVEKLGAS